MALALSSVPARAGDDPAAPVSGPEVGTVLTPVSCSATDGPFAGREFDAAAELGDGPGALLFIHELSRNTAPVIRGLDAIAVEHAVLGFRAFPILLSGDRTAGENQLRRVNGSLRLDSPIVLSIDGAEGPGNYALNRRCTLTLVLVDEGRVLASRAFTDTGPADVPRIREMVEKLTGPVPQDEGELRRLVAERLPASADELRGMAIDQAVEIAGLRRRIAQLANQEARGAMRREGGGAPTGMRERPATRGEAAGEGAAGGGDGTSVVRRGKPPEDPELNSLLRSFIRQTNDEAHTREVFARIEARAGGSDALEGEAVEMFRLMLSFRDRYGTPLAQELAEGFLEQHGGDADH